MQFASYDGAGNIAGFVKGTDGSVTATYEYDPYGQVIRATGSFAVDNPIVFSTKYRDVETDLLYFGYRYYSASLGKWLNRDPLEEQGGLNLYGFVFNDPNSFIDPFGLSETTDLWWKNMYENGWDDTKRFFGRIGSNLVDMGVAAARHAIDPGSIINDAIQNAEDLAQKLAKLAKSECERKKLLNDLKDYLSSPEAVADATMAAEAALAGRLNPDARPIPKPCLTTCFVAGTLVATETGLKPIEEITIDERVWAYDEETRKTALKPVISVYERPMRLLLSVQIGSETVVTTVEHRFWVENFGWVEAGALTPGALIKVREGNALPVRSVQLISRAETVYNLEVDDFHTYFAAQTGFLVHNGNGINCGFPRTSAENKKARTFFKNHKQEARERWEKRTGQKWPRDENGNAWPAEHTPSLKSGGDPMIVTPRDPGLADPHNVRGADGLTDYERWGALGPAARDAKKTSRRN